MASLCVRSRPPVVRLVNAFARPFENAVATARTCYSADGVVTPAQVRHLPGVAMLTLLGAEFVEAARPRGVSELANAIQEKSAVFQRCELTGIDKSSRMLFERVCDALDELQPLPRDFLRKLVAQAAPMGVAQARGSILILDEYDGVFGRLRAAGRRNEDARHLVIQPLLDQLVEYATENLLILLGQQPNAHFIFMDQNQLSAYVQQEPYPLFSHEQGTSRGEFWELISRTFQQT